MGHMLFHSGPEYLQLPRPREAWIIQDLLPLGGSMNIFGQPKAGKTLLALQFAVDIATESRESTLGFPVCQHGPVAYVQLDTSRPMFVSDYIEALTNDEHLDLSNLHITDRSECPSPFNILNPVVQKEFKDSLRSINPIAVVIDTIRDAHIGDENKSEHMQLVVTALADAVNPAALIVLSHARKAYGDGTTSLLEENRGSNYVSGRMDCIVKLNKTNLVFQSRVSAETVVRIERTSSMKRFLNIDTAEEEGGNLVRINPNMTVTTLANLLHKKFPNKSIDACYGIIKRQRVLLHRREGAR